MLTTFLALAALALQVVADKTPPSSSPHAYPGQPTGDYSPEWQTYFQVTDPLPGVDFVLGNHYAGNILVDRPGHVNDSLFFWAFEKENGSLTAAAGHRKDQPWAIWLQGGPGSSSLTGLFTENGPIRANPDKTLQANEYSWSSLIDYIWVDNPVGVGYSTADSDGYANDESEVADDLVRFLGNVVAVFPSLATRPFYLTGESYAGRYISYTAKALLSSANPPVKLAKIVVGDGAFGSNAEFKVMPVISLIETYPQVIAYDTHVYEYFKNQSHLCGFDINLTYPQNGPLPDIIVVPGAKVSKGSSDDAAASAPSGLSLVGSFVNQVASGYYSLGRTLRRRSGDLTACKDDMIGSAKGGVNPWYGCDLYDEVVDYAKNCTYPWSFVDKFDNFDVTDALKPEVSINESTFLNSDAVRTALHAPTDKNWAEKIKYPWSSKSTGGDPSSPPMTFLTELMVDVTAQNVDILMYVGNDDAISPHFGTEATIQNMTWAGIQGFQKKPSTPWFDENGAWAGIVHQERNLTYALFYGAGHEVASKKPIAAYTFIREFVLGNNATGLFSGGNVVGGENPTLAQGVIPGQAGIAMGTGATECFYTFPAATVAAWEQHVGAVSITGTGNALPTQTPMCAGVDA